jgi:hypothetical protein
MKRQRQPDMTWWVCSQCAMGYAANLNGICGDVSGGQEVPCQGVLITCDAHARRLQALNDLAARYADAPDIIGFRVFGPTTPYELHWNSEGRAPLRWRSGEWQLVEGTDGFEPIFKKAEHMSEPIVKFYKDEGKGGNGAFATVTTAREPDEFLRECASEMEALISDRAGDLEFTFFAVLPQICDLWAKLKGYRAEGVYEKRLLIAGEPDPEAHMRCMNVPQRFVPDEELHPPDVGTVG